MARLCETAHFWAAELRKPDKIVRKALEGVDPDGTRGESQPTYFLETVFNALTNSTDLDGNQERARKDKELADKLAMDNSIRRARTAEMPQVVAAWGDHISAARAKLLSMPTKLGPQLVNVADPNVIASRIRTEVHAAIDELAQWQPKAVDLDLEEPEESSRDLEESAATDSKPVGRRKAKAE